MPSERARKGANSLKARILAFFEQHPEGASIHRLRDELALGPGEQEQLDRRIRDLYPSFDFAHERRGREYVYILRGPKASPTDQEPISKALQAEVLNAARGRCAMCGRTILDDGIKLVIDHKVPRSWGGKTELDNLWAICSEDNGGKRDFFASIDSPEIRRAIQHKSVHVRIGELLKAYGGRAVDSTIIEVVAGQNDWPKRLRELRYLGWRIKAKNRKLPSGRVRASYELLECHPWPEDPSAVIRRYERDRLLRRFKD